MSYFDEAFKEVLAVEKGFVHSKYDNGGKTKFGISQKSYPDLDIKNLTLNEAKLIYKNDFWDYEKLKLSKVDDKDIAIELFDTSVNMGQYRAGFILQTALNNMNRNERVFEDLEDDGWIGIETLKALRIVLRRGEKKQLLKVLNGEQYYWYKIIIKHNPEQEMNFVGWMKRVSM
ncbi:hypothetical protein CRV02_00880 [Arcobacter sp. CECT 8989]|uniref:glycoside hydrolase family 108 protein n=1 Tax=Arcobacter sp. CECT 8989 TaxID=2044509 RepID=UPI00100B4850|nr:glycosyl hydrolase 108 family protein [Arcobacter sp. CECT 8989]RXK03779.1 hypothetical protein CRV02_00880 [Arcobacter sp. CECT 8989]